MPCEKCKKIISRCDSCWLVDGDSNYKEVTHCEKCDAFICIECGNNWIKRSEAYFIRKAEKIKEYLKKIF